MEVRCCRSGDNFAEGVERRLRLTLSTQQGHFGTNHTEDTNAPGLEAEEV